MGEHFELDSGLNGQVSGEVVGGAISPLPPVSSRTGESGATAATGGVSQVDAAARVAAGAAKRRGENFHQRAAEKLSAVKSPDALEPWRVPEETIAQVLTYVACGYSLRQAAAAVGRSHSTFVKLKQRDPKFACRLLQHRELARDKPLRQVLQASERSWRAAAWLLKYLDARERTPRAKRRDAAQQMSKLGHRVTCDVTSAPPDPDVTDEK